MTEHFKDIVDVKFTANLETKLDDIAEGTEVWNELLAKFYKTTSYIIIVTYGGRLWILEKL